MSGSRFSANPDLPIAAILAGGAGARMGTSTPKPLTLLCGAPVITHVIAALTPQVRGMVLGLRAPADWAAQFALPIITDQHQNIGPVASIAAVLTALRDTAPYVLTVPADCPFLPDDLAMRLRAGLADDVDIAVAASGGRRHHLIALWRTALAADAGKAIADGVQAIHRLQSRFRVAEVPWDAAPVDPFFNINTPDDLTQAEAICSSRRGEKQS